MARTAKRSLQELFGDADVLTAADRQTVACDLAEEHKQARLYALHRADAAYHRAEARAAECQLAWLTRDKDSGIAESRHEAAASVLIACVAVYVATPARSKAQASAKQRDLRKWAHGCAGSGVAVAAWRKWVPGWQSTIQAEIDVLGSVRRGGR